MHKNLKNTLYNNLVEFKISVDKIYGGRQDNSIKKKILAILCTWKVKKINPDEVWNKNKQMPEKMYPNSSYRRSFTKSIYSTITVE
jgi:hypothetical protein